MYEYRFFNTISNKAADIYDNKGDKIGKVEKYYKHLWERVVDMLLKGRFSGNYRLYDRNNNELINSQRSLNIFKKRQYTVEYKTDRANKTIKLVDEKSFGIGEITSFLLNEEKFILKKDVMDKAQISKDDSVIAEWESSIKVPFKAYFTLKDQKYENDCLLLLGLFHTYLHAG